MDVANNIKQWFAAKFKQVKGITMSLYWQSMQLAYDPFMAEQANQTPFVSPKWEQQLNLLIHLATNQDAMLLVLGVSGIGKSTMMRQFIDQLAHSGGICKIHGGATITTDVLQDLVARHLGFAVSQQEPEQFSSQLLERIGRMRAEGHDFYLVIDNAHKLPKASLAALLELVEIQGADQHPIHIILFGGPQLEALIGDITSQHLGEVLTHSLHLEPLTLEYLKSYVEQRLALAGFEGNIPFTQGQLQQIYQISGGVPAKVNSLARQLLLQWTQQANKKGSDKKTFVTGARQNQEKSLSVYWYAGAAVVVIAVVLMIMFYFNTPNANAIANQNLMVSSNKPAPQDYDEAGSESGVNTNAANHANVANAAVNSAEAVPDSSYTEVSSVNGGQDTDSGAVDSADDGGAASSSASSSSSQTNSNNANPSSVGSAATTTDTVTSADADDNDDVDTQVSVQPANDAHPAQSQATENVNQALAANASLAKPNQASAMPANATAAAATALPLGAMVASASATSASPAANTAVSDTQAKASASSPQPAQSSQNSYPALVGMTAAVPSHAQTSSDAEYIPSGSQIPVSGAKTDAVPSTTPSKNATTQATAAQSASMPKTNKSETTKVVPASTPKAAKSVKSTSIKSKPGLDTSYFQVQPTSHAALQIAGARDLSKLKQDVASFGLTKPVHYFETSMNGAPWYVAIYGNYPSFSAANDARSSLPTAVQATKPWARTFKSIQNAINAG